MRMLSLASDEHWRAFDAEAQLLARALRTGRLTVLSGALGVGKTTLLFAGVLPLLRRRVDDSRRQPSGAPQVVVPFPDQRSRVQGRGQGEQLYVVDQWNEAPLDWLVRALDTRPAAPRDRIGLADAMSPAHLSALSQRHGGARLLFMFDHFELLLEGAQHKPDLKRFVQAWTSAVQAPDLDAHFLVAVDDHAWPRVQALCACMPGLGVQAFRLQVRSGRQMLESLTDSRKRDGATKLEVSDATFDDAIGAVVPSGVELFRLIRQGRLEWRAEVAASELALIRPGQAVQVTAAGAAAVPGRVRMVAPTVDAATRNGLVYVDLPQPGAIKAGMFARGEFRTGSSSALTLPQGAVLLRDGFSYVFKLGADNKVTQAKVGVGRRVGERIEITTGLDAGTRVVASGAGFLADGDTVRVVEAAAAAPASAAK